MLEILLGNLPIFLTAIIAIGVVWKYLSKISAVLKEVVELLQTIGAALEDKKLTKEELDSIVKEFKDIPIAIKEAFTKE